MHNESFFIISEFQRGSQEYGKIEKRLRHATKVHSRNRAGAVVAHARNIWLPGCPPIMS